MGAPTASTAPARFGQVYRCAVCGAELTVIRAGAGPLTPRCCNTYMLLKSARATGYRCPICGSEIVVIRKGPGELRPRCCNREMLLR